MAGQGWAVGLWKESHLTAKKLRLFSGFHLADGFRREFLNVLRKRNVINGLGNILTVGDEPAEHLLDQSAAGRIRWPLVDHNPRVASYRIRVSAIGIDDRKVG